MAQESTGHEAEVFLPAAEPFDFTATLRFVRGFPAMVGEQGTDGGVLSQAVRENGAVVLARLRSAPSGGGLSCQLTASDALSERTVTAVCDRLAFQFGLGDDLGAFYATARDDPPFARVIEQLHGYHQVKFPSPLEILCWAILCQRVPLPVARTMKQELTAQAGNRVDDAGRRRWAFPDLDQLLALSEQQLLEAVGNARKASYLYRALRLWAASDQQFLVAGDYAEVRAWLLSLPGVGPWSASFILIRGLGRTEHIEPDKESLRAASRVYGHPVAAAEFSQLADRYGRWQGYWAHYLRVAG